MRRPALWLFALALIVRGVLALPMTQPGYMDEAYYFVNAATLARGEGLSENFIWNYLSHPWTLPQPSNAYWMPLPSLVIAPALWLAGPSYRAAQLVMLFLAAALIPLVYIMSRRLFGDSRWALTSALLMLASSFYLPFWSASDAFALYALFGTALLLLAKRANQWRAAFVCGIVIALAHLTRADGLLLFAPFLVVWWRKGRMLPAFAAAMLGYGVVMLPWYARNIAAFGTPLPGSGTLFLTRYDDLFSFEQPVSVDLWLAAGWARIAQNIARAFVLNLATLAGALHFVFLPFALIGLWRERQRVLAHAVMVYLAVLFAVMTFLFSVAGPRGTFLHSLSAVLPLAYVFAPPGLLRAVQWVAARRRTWNAVAAERVFGAAFAGVALLVSAYFYRANVFADERELGWNERYAVYRDVEAYLRSETRDSISPVLCINPPAYMYFNSRPAIAIPTDDPLAVIHAASQFAARFIIIEPDHPRFMDDLYSFASADPRFQLRSTFADARGAVVQLYQIVPPR